MKRVYKYPLKLEQVQYIGMPRGASVLSVQVQAGVICIWAMVDPDAAAVRTEIHIHGTGHDVDSADDLHWLGTVQVGAFVWHVFQKT